MSESDISLAGQVALVTGSTRGLGRAIANRLATAGADVVLHDQDAEQAAKFGEAAGAEDVVTEIAAHGTRTALVFGDVGDADAVERFVGQARAAMGRIDILVNCAGGDIGASGGKPEPNDCVEIPVEDVRAMFDRNVIGTIYCCRQVAPEMMARQSGRIVNVASSAGHLGVSHGAIYAVAKAGIVHYTRCLAAQMKPHGVNVNCVSPGPTVTARFLATRTVREERLNNPVRLMRFGEPDDIARAVQFLSSDLARYVNGQVLVVDGGGILW